MFIIPSSAVVANPHTWIIYQMRWLDADIIPCKLSTDN